MYFIMLHYMLRNIQIQGFADNLISAPNEHSSAYCMHLGFYIEVPSILKLQIPWSRGRQRCGTLAAGTSAER